MQSGRPPTEIETFKSHQVKELEQCYNYGSAIAGALVYIGLVFKFLCVGILAASISNPIGLVLIGLGSAIFVIASIYLVSKRAGMGADQHLKPILIGLANFFSFGIPLLFSKNTEVSDSHRQTKGEEIVKTVEAALTWALILEFIAFIASNVP